MNGLEIYLFTRLDTLNGLTTAAMVIAICFTVASVIGCIISYTSQEHHRRHYGDGDRDFICWGRWYETWSKVAKRSLAALVVSALLVLLVPTQKEAAAIYLIPRITSSEAAKELSTVPADAAKILKLKLGQYITDLEPQAAKVK